MKSQTPAAAFKTTLGMVAMLVVMVSSADAAVIEFSPLHKLDEKVFASFAVDPVTDTVYERHGGFGSAYRDLNIYADMALNALLGPSYFASKQFGVALPPIAAVPEPASIAMDGLGLVEICFSEKWALARHDVV